MVRNYLNLRTSILEAQYRHRTETKADRLTKRVVQSYQNGNISDNEYDELMDTLDKYRTGEEIGGYRNER